jgi:hypothetical protein
MVANGKSPARHKQEERYALANTTTVFDFAKRYVTEIVERTVRIRGISADIWTMKSIRGWLKKPLRTSPPPTFRTSSSANATKGPRLGRPDPQLVQEDV